MVGDEGSSGVGGGVCGCVYVWGVCVCVGCGMCVWGVGGGMCVGGGCVCDSGVCGGPWKLYLYGDMFSIQ